MGGWTVFCSHFDVFCTDSDACSLVVNLLSLLKRTIVSHRLLRPMGGWQCPAGTSEPMAGDLCVCDWSSLPPPHRRLHLGEVGDDEGGEVVDDDQQMVMDDESIWASFNSSWCMKRLISCNK